MAMKKAILLFLISFLYLSAFAQEDNFKFALDSISDNDVTFRKFTYDERGNLLSNIGQSDTLLYTYDLNNNIISEETYDYYGLVFKNKIDYLYQNYLLTDITSYNYNENYDYTNDKWNPDRKTTYSYTQTNEVSQKVMYRMSNNQWEHLTTNIYIYDTNDNLIIDSNAGGKVEYKYDENNNKLSATILRNSGSNWIYTTKLVWTYDSNNNVLDETPYIYENENWIFYGYAMRLEFTYDSQNNLLSKTKKELIANQWINKHKETYSYDQNKNCLTDSIFIFENGEWAGDFGYIYNYDANNNKLSKTMIQCYNSEWFFNVKTEYQYDYNYTYDDLYLPNYINSANMIVSYTDYTDWNNQWNLSGTIFYHYTKRTISLNEISNNNMIRIYPNPTINFIVLEINETSPFEYEIYNTNGIIVKKGISQNTIRIDIHDLNSGLYFCNITFKNKLHKSKFIKI